MPAPLAAIAALASGTQSATEGLVGNLVSNFQNNRNRHWEEDMYNVQLANNLNILNSNRQWEEYMNATNNAFNSEEAQKAHERSKELLKLQQDYNTHITDPAYIMQRAAAAGINPYALLGSSGAGSGGSAPSGAAASASGHAPAGSIGSASVGQPQQYPLGVGSVAASMRDISEALYNAAKTEQEGVNTQRLQATFNSFVKQQDAQANKLGAEANLSKFVEPLLKTSQTQLNYALRNQAIQNAYKAYEEGNEAVAREELTKAKKATEDIVKDLNGWQAKIAKKSLEFMDETHETNIKEGLARIQELGSRSAQQSAQAGLTNEQTEQLKQMRSYLVNIKKFEADEKEAISDVAKRTVDAAVVAAQQANVISYFEGKKLEQDVRRYKADNDLRAFHEILNTLERINNGITNYIPLAPDKVTVNSVDNWSNMDENGHILNSRDRVNTQTTWKEKQMPWQK